MKINRKAATLFVMMSLIMALVSVDFGLASQEVKPRDHLKHQRVAAFDDIFKEHFPYQEHTKLRIFSGKDDASSYSMHFDDSSTLRQIEHEFVPREVIVKFKSNTRMKWISDKVATGISSVDELNSRFKVKDVEMIFSSVYKLTLQEDFDVISVAMEYEADPNVEYAEPNYIYHAYVVPNDVNYTLQWAHQLIDSELAWDVETGDSDVVIAIVDTGVDWDHPDLAANIWNNTDEIVDGIDDDGNGYIDDVRGWDFFDDDNDPMDFDGHGTHCAGIAAAVTNNGVGIAGMCWNSKIMALRAGTAEGLKSDDCALAIRYAADNGVHVISMSWGSPYRSETIKREIDYAYSKGCVLVAAAGNDDLRQKFYPAALDNVIAVGATDQDNDRAYFSNYGSWIDVSAPGVGIYSTYFGDTYNFLQGTSMSTPLVAGLAGLLLSKKSTFTNEEVRNVLRSTTDPVISWEYIGLGRINAHKSLQRDIISIANLNSSMDDATVRGLVKINGTASGGDFKSYELYYGLGTYPTEWTQIGSTEYSTVENGVLATWDTSLLPDGIYTVRLKVYDINNEVSEDRVVVWVSQMPAPGYYETSEYMIGSVAVGIIFLESNGTIDPETENWTSSEELQVTNEIEAALSWWAGQNPSANVSFAYDIHYRVPTSYEPINRSYFPDRELWISEAMAFLGYGGYWWWQVSDYVNDLRDTLGTDWAFAVFIIDSSKDSDGRFEDGPWGIYTRGGPFCVVTYDCGEMGINKMDCAVASLVGYIFYATAEYNGETEWSGYLNEHDFEDSGCLMDNFNLSLSEGTRGQVGWRDTDGDAILDIVDTFPEVSLKPYSPDPTSNTSLQYTGTASVNPYPTHNPRGTGRAVTINEIEKVQFRVDSGSWMDANATDGAFGNPVESFNFTTPELSVGEHTIEVRAINSVGNSGYDVDTVTVSEVMRDVAVVNIKPSKTVVGQGYSFNINVTVENQGDVTETFNVTAYANTTIIKTKETTLTSGNSTTIVFICNTTGFVKGNYTISAYATPLPGETDTIDNTYRDGWVVVAMVGDITGPEGFPDGKVEMRDVSLVASKFGVNYPDPRYDANCDITGPTPGVADGKIEMRDVSLVASNFGKIDP